MLVSSAAAAAHDGHSCKSSLASLGSPRSQLLDEKKTQAVYKDAKRFAVGTSWNQPPELAREERTRIPFRHVNIRDSGWSGRWYKHILQGSLWLVTVEMTAYIFIANLVFGWAYWISGGCCGEEDAYFWDDFNFSFQTFTTVGYGALSPEGVTANVLVFFQGIHNILVTTIFAGVVFTKFIRPRWKFMFSDCMVVHNVRGAPHMCLRFGCIDGTYNPLLNVSATAYLSRSETDEDGFKFFPTRTLALETDSKYSVQAVWTLQHRIDEASPMFNRTSEDMQESTTHFHVTVMGIDPVTEETVCKMIHYGSLDVLFGYNFVDQVSWVDGHVTTDFANFNKLKPAPCYYPVRKRKARAARGTPADPAAEAAAAHHQLLHSNRPNIDHSISELKEIAEEEREEEARLAKKRNTKYGSMDGLDD